MAFLRSLFVSVRPLVLRDPTTLLSLFWPVLLTEQTAQSRALGYSFCEYLRYAPGKLGYEPPNTPPPLYPSLTARLLTPHQPMLLVRDGK